MLLAGRIADRELQAMGFEVVQLPLAQHLIALGSTTSYAYFPTEGVISLLSSTPAGESVEVAAIGREGVAVSPFIAGIAPSPFHLVVQVEGAALRIDHRQLVAHLHQSPELAERLLRFVNTLVGQISQSAVCNRFHSTRQRLARWLLFIADRAQRETVPMTHEFAALMVGGTRPRVTAAVQGFRRKGLIEYRRRAVTILNRDGLAQMSCECYGMMTSYFDGAEAIPTPLGQS